MIFVVEDDHGVRELELYALRQSGYEAEGYETPTAFRQALEKTVPDCVLLDVMLPGEDGLSLLRFLRRDARTRRVPVILVTARDAEMDKVKGLDCGADDYLTKPFGVMELLARVRALLRRTQEETPSAAPRFHIKITSSVFKPPVTLPLYSKERVFSRLDAKFYTISR